MRECPRCKVNKPHSEWGRKNGDGFQSYCKLCWRDYCNQHRAKHREKYNELNYRSKKKKKKENYQKLREYLLSHPCEMCGNGDLLVLEFDHLRDKEENISVLVANGNTWSRIKREIDKCQVLCANCHRIKTHQGTWRDLNVEL